MPSKSITIYVLATPRATCGLCHVCLPCPFACVSPGGGLAVKKRSDKKRSERLLARPAPKWRDGKLRAARSTHRMACQGRADEHGPRRTRMSAARGLRAIAVSVGFPPLLRRHQGVRRRMIRTLAQKLGALPFADCQQTRDVIVAEHVGHGHLGYVWSRLTTFRAGCTLK